MQLLDRYGANRTSLCTVHNSFLAWIEKYLTMITSQDINAIITNHHACLSRYSFDIFSVS